MSRYGEPRVESIAQTVYPAMTGAGVYSCHRVMAIAEFLQGFMPSRAEIIAFVVVIPTFVGALIAYTAVLRRRERRRLRTIAERRYRELAGAMPLTRSDMAVLEILSRYQKRPDGKALLLQNHSVFNACAERAISDGAVREGAVSALRVRCEIAGRPAGARPDSSAEIPVGSGVFIVDGGDRAIHGRVLEPSSSAFRVETDGSSPQIASGTLVMVVYQSSSGIYEFHAAVLRNLRGEIELSHSEHVRHVQRRRYYRDKVLLPVHVKLASAPEHLQRSRFTDIGGGGASFLAPDERYKRGGEVEMMFHPDSRPTIHLTGRIVRESQRGKIVHVSFDNMRPSARDRVLGLLFRNQRRSLESAR